MVSKANIIHDVPNYSQAHVCDFWGKTNLTITNKNTDEFRRNSFTLDETSVYHFHPESKRQSKECRLQKSLIIPCVEIKVLSAQRLNTKEIMTRVELSKTLVNRSLGDDLHISLSLMQFPIAVYCDWKSEDETMVL